MDKKEFKENLNLCLEELDINKEKCVKFKITTVIENSKRYNSNDDFMKLAVLDRANLEKRYLDIDGVINILSAPNSRFPLWIIVEIIEININEYIIELKTSLRFRPPSVLQNQETGHQPFKVIKN